MIKEKKKKRKKHTTFFLLSNQNFPCYNCPVTMCFQEQCGSLSSVHSPQVLEEGRRILKTLPTSQMRNNTLRWSKMATEALQCLMVETSRSARVTEQIKLALFQSIPNSSKSPKQSIGVCWNIRFSLGFSFTQVSQK